MTAPQDHSRFEFRTLVGATLSDEDRKLIFELFDACYREANHTYLEKTLERLRNLTLAFDEGRLVAFGTGEQRVADLPGLPQTRLTLGGLTCVSAQYRRLGLVAEMGRRNMERTDLPERGQRLVCGRNAHPASFTMFRLNPSLVPRSGGKPAAWHQEVGRAVAEIYGADNFDPETFVCVGSGTPIGYPIIEMEATSEEWEVFQPVNRDRGDTLLGIVWLPDAPAGW